MDNVTLCEALGEYKIHPPVQSVQVAPNSDEELDDSPGENSLPLREIPSGFFRPCNKKYNLAEIYGREESMPEMTLVAEDGRQIGAWVKCKDFIQDVYWAKQNRVSYSIYGYDYNPTIEPLPSDRNLILAMRWKGKSDKQMDKMMGNVKRTVEWVERNIPWKNRDGKTRNGIPKFLRSEFTKTQNGVFIIFGSRIWFRSIACISFFTWLIRASLMNEGETIDSIGKTPPNKKDIYYLKSGKRFVETLMEKGLDAFKPDFDNHDSVVSVHNNGFVGWSCG